MGHETLSPIAIHNTFRESFFGQKAAEITRWSHRQPASMTNKEWEHLLGADMNDITHMQLMYGLTRFFIHHCETPPKSWKKGEVPKDAQFTPYEKRTFEILAITHDWPEAIMGDKQLKDKNKHDDAEEAHLLFSLAYTIFPLPVFTESLERNAIVDASGNLNNQKTKIGRAFRVVEHLGYLRTCLIAKTKANEILSKKISVNNEEDVLKSLNDMGTTVAGEEIEWLKKNGMEYPAVMRFFEIWGINIDKV